jgi:predicted ATPase with chaperone activity
MAPTDQILPPGPLEDGVSSDPSTDPSTPQSVEDLGLPRSFLIDLVLRYGREHGTMSLSMLRKALKLSFPVVDSLFQELRQQQLVDVKATSGHDYSFALTSRARELAADRSQVCRYAGPAPVPVEQYAEMARRQKPTIIPTPEAFREAFSDLVVAEDVLDRLGPALISGRPLFVYGPTGNGKTSLIERFPRIFDDLILVPYAVEVDSHIISVFDPLVHRGAVEGEDGIDPRWVRCRRPCVMAAGELTPAMLDLRLDDRSGVYAAPLQLKAMNGILLIDDFGRQRMPPSELFNRWILPLDRRVDYLSLEHGFTFQIPFELTLVFATNLPPSSIADDAFLRRVPNKIYIRPVSPDEFDEIFRRVLAKHGVPCEPKLAAFLRSLCTKIGGSRGGLRACYPSDICEILLALSTYKGQPFRVTPLNLTAAAETYFAHDDPWRQPGPVPK